MITDKASFFEAYMRNNYYMPKYSESFITIKFMRGLRKGKYFMPKTDVITKKQVADIFTKALDKTSFLKFRDALLHNPNSNSSFDLVMSLFQ